MKDWSGYQCGWVWNDDQTCATYGVCVACRELRNDRFARFGARNSKNSFQKFDCSFAVRDVTLISHSPRSSLATLCHRIVNRLSTHMSSTASKPVKNESKSLKPESIVHEPPAKPSKTSKQLKRELESVQKQKAKVHEKGNRLRDVKRCSKCCDLMLSGHSMTCRKICFATQHSKLHLCPRKDDAERAKGMFAFTHHTCYDARTHIA